MRKKIGQEEPRRSGAHVVIAVVGLTGIAGFFLPFVVGVSPWQATWETGFFDAWRLGLPASLAILVSAGTLRWLFCGSLSAPERIIAYLVSTSMAVVSLSLWYPGLSQWFEERSLPTSTGWLLLSVHVLPLVLGVAVLVRNWRTGRCRQFTAIMSLQVVYVAHAAVLLLIFAGDPALGIGAYFVLAAALTFVVQIVLVSVKPAPRTLSPAPNAD